MHSYTPVNSIFDGPIATLLSVLLILVEVMRTVGKALMISNLARLFGRFSNGGAASTAVKGLNLLALRL